MVQVIAIMLHYKDEKTTWDGSKDILLEEVDYS